MTIKIPSPLIKRRVVNSERKQEAINSGLDPLLAQIISARPFLTEFDPKELLSPRLSSLDNPTTLADIEPATDRIVKAIINQEVIGLETDHDCDGQTSHAVLYTALVDYFGFPRQKLRSYIGHRLKEGYGLSKHVAARILADDPKPSLIITADNGSSDEEQIAVLKANGIDVIVTDHHEIPADGIPKSALAVINPTRPDCKYPDPCIAGCMVAWLLMAATRIKLLEQGYMSGNIPSLKDALDYVAVGTIADCVSIARSNNNRAIVSYGLKLIQQGLRPCWKALLPRLSFPISSEDLGFKIGPLLNSDGRLDSAFGSVSFLLAENDEEAFGWLEHLEKHNIERKSIQKKITDLGMRQASEQYLKGNMGLSLFIEQGHPGVHGISASRIKDAFGRPTVIFSPKEGEDDIITGSARSIDDLHLRDALQEVADAHPSIVQKFGGHKGAAGITIAKDGLAVFSEEFDNIIKAKLSGQELFPIIWTDGIVDVDYLNKDSVFELISSLEPFGREFEPPVFEAIGKVLSINFMGAEKNHAKLGICVDDLWLECLWFNCRENANCKLAVSVKDEVKFAFVPKLNTFRGECKLNALLQDIRPV